MRKIYGLILLCLLLCSGNPAKAQVSIDVAMPSVRIGINLPVFPELVPVPGYPVYYAPRVSANYFFYDGMYWVYRFDNWYASYWYNGPWWMVEPDFVPLFILRIPVRYYRRPPAYFRHWHSNAPPRWGEHWGHSWEQRRSGWDRWRRDSAPPRAPLPVYQRRYSGDRYPRVEQQRKIRHQNYRYQPRERVVRERFMDAPARPQRGRQEKPDTRTPGRQELRRPVPPQREAPLDRRDRERSPVPVQPPARQRGPAFEDQRQQRGPAQREQQAPRPPGLERKSQDRQESHEPGRGRGQGPDKDEGRGRGQGPGKDEGRGKGRD